MQSVLHHPAGSHVVRRQRPAAWASQGAPKPCSALGQGRRAVLSTLAPPLVAAAFRPGAVNAAVVEEAVRQAGPPASTYATTSLPSTSGGLAPPPPTYVTATGRIVAIGDLHGDWQKAIDSLVAANVVELRKNEEIVWTGGDTVVVQLGDVLDRGDHEIAIVKLLRALDIQARQKGGAVYMLNGNHESLNVCGDFRYVTPGAFFESALFAGLGEQELKDWELLARVRYAVYKPGGPMANELAKNPTVLVVNDTAFAHGGLLPVHVNYGIEKLNAEVASWMRAEKMDGSGKAAPPFLAMGDANSVMWNRTLSKERFPTTYERFHACSALTQALAKINAKRLVVGHTPQLGGANCECDGCVWRIDVGMSYGVLNKPVQVIEINKDASGEASVKVINAPSGVHQSNPLMMG